MFTYTADNAEIHGMVKRVIIIAMLFLAYCNKGQQAELPIKKRGNTELPIVSALYDTKTSAENVTPDTSSLGLETVKPIELELEEKVSIGLLVASIAYEKRFNQPLPACKQCTEWDMLLVLERAVSENVAYSDEIRYVLSRIDSESAATLEELKKIEVAYKEKFARPIPWWWVCSGEECLKRLEHAINVGIPYPDYSSKDYKLGKAMAKYEMWFKKPPEEHCSNSGCAERLELAVAVGVPYLTKKSDTKLEAKLKAGFKKKVVSKKSITKFERSVVGVDFKIEGRGVRKRISVIRTATGATAKYRMKNGYQMEHMHKIEQPLEIKLNIREWLIFVNALHRCRISEWEKRYDSPKSFGGTAWSLNVFLSAGGDNDYISIWGHNVYPPNWDRFKGIMDDMEARIKNEQ